MTVVVASKNCVSNAAGPDLGILFVHGIGDQRRAQTLVDFGTPVVTWLAARAAQLDGSVTFAQATLDAEDTPANVEIHIERAGASRCWLMAETWWAESFAPRSFRELASWSFSVIPWTFGSHFGRRLSRAWHEPRDGWRFLRWVFGVFVAFGVMLVGVASSIPVMGVFSFLLVVSLIPWRRLQSSIQSLQLRLASTLGDSLIFVSRPIESAAITTQFRRDLDWLIQKGCHRIAVVAHSQGAAVAVRALSNSVPDRVKLLITFGSGLRKLEELELLRQNRSLRLGANLTLFGLVIVGFATMFSIGQVLLWRASVNAPEVTLEGGGIFLAYLILGFALLITGFLDFFRGPTIPRIASIGKSFKTNGVTWKDLYASSDPVPNGSLNDNDQLSPESIEVMNRASMFKDHTSYWGNRDTFVAYVADSLVVYDDPPILPTLDPVAFKDLATRRRNRVRILVASAWLGIASVTALLFRYASDWGPVLVWSFKKGGAQIAGIFGANFIVDPAPSADKWWRTLGWLALILAAQINARLQWSAFDKRASERPPPSWYDGDWHLFASMAVWVQLAVIGIALYPHVPAWWAWPVSIALVVVGMIATTTAPKSTLFQTKAEKEDVTGSVNVTARTLFNLFQFAILLIAWVSILSKPFGWIRRKIAEEFGQPPDWIVAQIVTLGFFAAIGVWLAYRAAVAYRHRKQAADQNAIPLTG